MPDENLTVIQPPDLFATIQKGYYGYDMADDNDDNPTVKSLAYQSQNANVRRCFDFYTGSSAWVTGEDLDTTSDRATEYLPIMPAETSAEWMFRVKRTLFINFFKPAVRTVAALLTSWQFSETVPDVILATAKNFDKRGTSIKAFSLEADRVALRDGFVGVLTSYPDFGEIPNRAVESQLDLRPYSILIPRADIDIKAFEYAADGSVLLKHVTIDRSECINEGRYKQAIASLIWEYELIVNPETGSHMVTRTILQITKDEKNKTKILVLSAGKLLIDVKGKPLDQIPLVLYSLTDPTPWGSMPPLLDLQQKNRTYYQVFSDWLATVRKMQPTPVCEHMDFIPENMPPLSTGGASVINAVYPAKLYYLQADGASTAPMIQALDRLEASIKETVFSFLGESLVAQTATESVIKATQNKAGLEEFKINKESCWEQIFSHWALWMGEDVKGDYGTIDLDLSFMLAPANVDLIRVVFENVSRGMTEEAATEILHRINFLPKDQKITAIALPVEPTLNQTSEVPDANMDSK